MQIQMQNMLISLSEEVIKGGERGPQANLHFRNIINEVRNLQQCLYCIGLSDNYTFVYCSNMIKLIESGQFCLISQTKSQENILNLVDNINNTKVKVYGQIISVLVNAILSTKKPNYIAKTIKDLIALCLKALFQDNSFFSFLQKTINLFMPNYTLIESFNTNTQTVLNFIAPRYNVDSNSLNNYCTLLQILSSMFEFITVHSTSKTYYQYRRSIYVFRNAYLAHFLYFVVQNCKIVFQNFHQGAEALRNVMKLTIELMEHVFLYPFTLSLHQFQIEEDSTDNISNGSNDLYFPNYFRHVICDIPFLQDLWKYTLMVINSQENFNQKRNQLNSLVKVMGRVCCPSQYTFKNDQEKQFCRQFAIKTVQELCQSHRYADSYYLNTIMDILYKMLTIYDFYFTANRQLIIDSMLNFLFRVMQQTEIKIDQGKRSPFSRVFQLLSLCIQYNKDKAEQQAVVSTKVKCQKILQKAFQRLLSPEAIKIMSNFGFNQPTEIQYFSELFQYVGGVFESSLENNLNFMQNVNLYNLSLGSITIWLHLCSQLIPKTAANLHQTRIILKYYELAKNGDSLASLRYIKTFVDEVMSDFREDTPANPLWANIQELTPVSFEEFILCVINICMNNFNKNNNQILDYSLELFKSIYTTLRKFDNKNFQRFYQIVQNLLQNIDKTVFYRSQYYHKRQDFFNVISVIWINSDNLDYTYKIYQLISANLKSNTPESFFQYLHDITGLIEPLDHHQAFQVLTELALESMTSLFALHMYDQAKTKMYFKEPHFIKIFCRLIYAMISDINRKLFFQTHTKIPLKIHKIVYPYIKFLAEANQEFEYPKNFANILQKMINLNPLNEIVCFASIIKQLKQQAPDCFERLIRAYFEHIQRVADISWMYDLIGGNPEYMVCWWEEAMIRNLHPKTNFKIIAESRFWTNNRQREIFAKLLFELGYYDKQYWSVQGFESQRQFVEQFTKAFT